MTDYLFASPSFLIGMGRALDVGGQFDDYNFSRTPEEADAQAVRADFLAVGRDLARALKKVRGERG